MPRSKPQRPAGQRRAAEKERPRGPELDAYLESVPAIYRDVLASFPRIEPTRRKGYGLALQTIHADLADQHSLGELHLAAQELVRHGIVETRHGIFLHPTELGEELIARLCGREAGAVQVPPLPAPPAPR